MELRHLRYFVAVAEEGSFTRAAERLRIAQPPLSQQIRALEEELGFVLFRRHSRGSELTHGGEVFLKEAQRILLGVRDAAAKAARAATGHEGVVNVGLTSSAAAHPLIPRIMRAFRAARPGVALEFSEGNAAELIELLTADRLNVAFLRRPVTTPPGLVFHELLVEELLLVLPIGHPALGRRSGSRMPTVSLAALRNERFILVRRRGARGMYSDLIDACERAGFTPEIGIEVDRMLTGITLVAAGAGVSAVPRSMKGIHEESVVYCRIDTDPGAPLTLSCVESCRIPAVVGFVEVALGLASRTRR